MLNTQNHFSHLPEKPYIPQFHRISQSAPADSQYWPFYINSFYRKLSFHFRNRFRVSGFCEKLAKRIVLYPNPQHFLKQPKVHLFLKQKDQSRNPSELQRHGGSALVIPEPPPHGQAGTELSSLHLPRARFTSFPFCYTFATKLSNPNLYEKYS